MKINISKSSFKKTPNCEHQILETSQHQMHLITFQKLTLKQSKQLSKCNKELLHILLFNKSTSPNEATQTTKSTQK